MSESTSAELMIIDVCGTLVRDDTTMGLLAHHFTRQPSRPIRRILFKLMTSRFSPIRMGFLLLERVSGRHLFKHFAVRLLKGDKVHALNDSAESYAAILLVGRRIQPVWDMLNSHRNRNGRVILASASLEPIVKCLAVATNADFVASQLAEENGVLTGRYIVDMTGRKDAGIEEKYGICLAGGEFSFISDNVTDRPLMEEARSAFVILHKRSHRSRWSGLNATFLELIP